MAMKYKDDKDNGPGQVSLVTLALEYGISTSGVDSHLKKHGVATLYIKCGKTVSSKAEKESVINDYVNLKLSVEAIVKKYNFKEEAVLDILKENGVKVRVVKTDSISTISSKVVNLWKKKLTIKAIAKRLNLNSTQVALYIVQSLEDGIITKSKRFSTMMVKFVKFLSVGLPHVAVKKLRQKYVGTISGVCEICKKPHDHLQVDHKHGVDGYAKNGPVRGMLCTMCNTALGLFLDDLAIVNNSIAYLKETDS